METFRPCIYTNAVYKTADGNSTLQMSNRVIVEHPEQMGYSCFNGYIYGRFIIRSKKINTPIDSL